MDIIKEMTVKRFNSLIRSGCPIKIETREKYGTYIKYAIVKQNEGSVLHCVFVVGGEVKEHSIYIEELQKENIKIELLTDPLKS